MVGDGVAPTEPVEASATARPERDGVWRLTLATRQGGVAGRRAFEADSCVAVAEAAALVIAMMMAPNARLEAPGPAPSHDTKLAPRAVAPPSRAAARPEVPTAAHASGNSEAVRMRLSPAVTLDAGSLPAPTLGVGAVWSVGTHWFGVDFHGVWWPARRRSLPERSGSGVEVGLVTAGAQGCALLGQLGSTALRGCLGGEIGSLSADAFGVSRTQAAHPFWAGVAAGLGWEVSLGRAMAAWVQAGAIAPLTRPAMVVSPYGEVFRPESIATRGAAGLAYAF